MAADARWVSHYSSYGVANGKPAARGGAHQGLLSRLGADAGHHLSKDPWLHVVPESSPRPEGPRGAQRGGGPEETGSLGDGISWERLGWFAGGQREERQVLHGLFGRAPSGQLTAVMGPSGSGKTTLLDILAMRKTVGRTEGSVRINGQERRPGAYQRASAFILQESSILPTLTVAETMWYHAEMVLPRGLPGDQRRERIDGALRLVGLSKARATLVGGPLPGGYGLHGLSSGERKRLSIAAAMLTKPVLVFADEPTSGIDSFASLRVTEVLKELAAGGRAVVVTLHQPRDAVWRLFDRLYLLSEGRLLYSGPPSGATSWFGSLGYQAPATVSVADWILELVAIGFDKAELGWRCLESAADVERAAAEFARGELAERVREEIAASLCLAQKEHRAGALWPTAASESSRPDSTAAVPRWAQMRALLARHVLNYSRNLGNVVARLLLSLIAGLLVGVCYSGLRLQEDSDSRAFKIRIGSLFFCCLILMLSPNCSMGLFVADRRFYSSEAAAHMYGSLSYYATLALCELVVNMVAAVLFWTPVCLLSGAGQRHSAGYLRGLLVSGLMQLCGAQIVNFCAMLLPNQELAFVLSVAINVSSFITAGFLIKTRSLPWHCAWIRYASPVKFGFHAFVLNELVGKRFDVLRQVDQLMAAVCEVGSSGCTRPGVVEPRPAVSWWLRRPELQGATRTALGDVLGSIDPCLFETVRDGQEALACLQLDEPSGDSMFPSLVAMALQLLVLHLLGWLCLRHLHKERR